MRLLAQAPRQPQADLRKTYDAVIVGSGAAGGMAAYVLTAQGLDVLLLEAGKQIDTTSVLKSMEWPYDHPRRGEMPAKYHALTLNEYNIRTPPYATKDSAPEKVFSYDEMLDAISLYWLTNTGTSSSRSYWEGAQAGGGPFNAFDIPTLPVAVTVFPAEIYRAPRSWGEKAFGNLIYWNEVDKGGHFAAWEQPELFAEEVRAAFRSLR